MTSTAVIPVPQAPDELPLALISPLTAEQVLERVNLIKTIKRAVMVPGVHYGPAFPGSDKDVLLKPGADTLILTFQLVPSFQVSTEYLDAGHREYSVKCQIKTMSGHLVAEGVGSASTLETKYRYRNDIVADSVPPKYWQTRNPSDLGTQSGLEVKKVKGDWKVVRRVEVQNIADVYNTTLKIGKKRAYVDATITATGSSDLFTQDLEESQDQDDDKPKGKRQAGAPASPQNGKGNNPGDVLTIEGKLEKVWESNGFFNCELNGRQLWTKSAEIGAEMQELVHQKVQAQIKVGAKPGSFQLLIIAPKEEERGQRSDPNLEVEPADIPF